MKAYLALSAKSRVRDIVNSSLHDACNKQALWDIEKQSYTEEELRAANESLENGLKDAQIGLNSIRDHYEQQVLEPYRQLVNSHCEQKLKALEELKRVQHEKSELLRICETTRSVLEGERKEASAAIGALRAQLDTERATHKLVVEGVLSTARTDLTVAAWQLESMRRERDSAEEHIRENTVQFRKNIAALRDQLRDAEDELQNSPEMESHGTQTEMEVDAKPAEKPIHELLNIKKWAVGSSAPLINGTIILVEANVLESPKDGFFIARVHSSAEAKKGPKTYYVDYYERSNEGGFRGQKPKGDFWIHGDCVRATMRHIPVNATEDEQLVEYFKDVL